MSDHEDIERAREFVALATMVGVLTKEQLCEVSDLLDELADYRDENEAVQP